MQLVPMDVSFITIKTDTSLQKLLLNPDYSKWLLCFQARCLHAVVTSYAHVHFAPLNPHTVLFSKIISRSFGPPLLNVDNIDLLYNSINDGLYILFTSLIHLFN